MEPFAQPYHAAPPITIELDPVYNALNSIMLLHQVERMPALDAWIVRTATVMTPDQRHTNRLIFECLGGALLPDQEWANVPAYLDALAAEDPALLRARVAQPATVPRDAALWSEAQALLADPPALQRLIVEHVRAIWDAGLAAEWKRAQPALQKMIAVAEQRPQEQIAENLRQFIVGNAACSPDVERVICVPSPHTGRYVTRIYHQGTLRLFFHSPSNYAVLMRTSAVGRAELLARLEALADDTRLRILELFAAQNELSAPEIMARLELSQSSVSRHLKQLSPYLVERRGEGASKFYSLGPTQLDLTFSAVQRIVAGAESTAEEAPAVPSDFSQPLQRLLDAQGRVVRWPAKRRDQLLILEYLAAQFAPGRDYSEKQVNALLIGHMHPVFKDYAIIRRELYDQGYLDRERDGSRYSRVERSAAQPEASN